jgi:hypothetical protein
MVPIRSSCTPGERGEDYFCHVCLPEIERAAAAVFHGLGRKQSHLASTEMVREELERSRAAMRPNSVVLKSSHLSGFGLRPRKLRESRLWRLARRPLALCLEQ